MFISKIHFARVLCNLFEALIRANLIPEGIGYRLTLEDSDINVCDD